MRRFQSTGARWQQPPRVSTCVRRLDRSAAARRAWIPVLICFALALTPSVAPGQSAEWYSCKISCEMPCNSVPYTEQGACRAACAHSCDNQAPSVPRPYGAIAYGSNRAEAISWNKGSQAEADKNALASCNQYGRDCRIVYRYKNTCAALAATKDGRHCESATGNTEQDAQTNATTVCEKNWGNCKSNLSACSLTGSAAKPSPPPPPKAISWGAIAYSNADMGAGWSRGKNDRASAEKEAMGVCSQRGRRCLLISAFNKQCGALAADRNFYGWGVSPDQRDAQQRAVAECAKAGGGHCVLHISFCSF